ncbi:nucleotide-diphospho-sugar transferase [Radiomyces spectabilis]|uniref:nucleotide-diphospho-sugar transferase n=1 Tax=Radiomyces spectabilis TaxID=64574 RepID=UPI00221F77B5|nr:nucleotide-diphospho-sugar transferase [Radiomyces spectabilis]KAI8376089.1 nucleotide-diphospho-sugar transferase [Radiomyces spectabilis]
MISKLSNLILLLCIGSFISLLLAKRYLNAYFMFPSFQSDGKSILAHINNYDVTDYPPLPMDIQNETLCEGQPPFSNFSRDSILVSRETTRDHHVNAAIVFLIEFLDRPLAENHREMMRFNQSLWSLYENFSKDYPSYPILIFHESPFTPKYQKHYRNMWPSQLDITFYLIEFDLPPSFPRHPPHELGLTSTNRRAFPGYNHMIHFFFKDIFDHPAIRDLDYYWRLDHDSEILSPVSVDLFEYMRRHRLLYGYRTVVTDARHVTHGLLSFFDRWRRDPSHQSIIPDLTCAALSQKNCLSIPSTLAERNAIQPLMYYNNFEIVHIPTWRSEPMRQLTDAVHDTNMIYWDRWGDAPLRYYAVQTMLDVKSQTMEWCHIRYRHHKTFEPLCRLTIM